MYIYIILAIRACPLAQVRKSGSHINNRRICRRCPLPCPFINALQLFTYQEFPQRQQTNLGKKKFAFVQNNVKHFTSESTIPIRPSKSSSAFHSLPHTSTLNTLKRHIGEKKNQPAHPNSIHFHPSPVLLSFFLFFFFSASETWSGGTNLPFWHAEQSQALSFLL